MKTLKITALTIIFLNTFSALAAEPAVDDSLLGERVYQALRNDALTQDALVLVASERGFVLLVGQVLSQESRDKATNIAALRAGGDMRRLINELQIVGAIDDSTAVSDQSLTESIEKALKTEKPELAKSVKIITHRSVVYLMGAVSPQQGKEAGTFVSTIPGISNIKTVFEYVQE